MCALRAHGFSAVQVASLFPDQQARFEGAAREECSKERSFKRPNNNPADEQINPGVLVRVWRMPKTPQRPIRETLCGDRGDYSTRWTHPAEIRCKCPSWEPREPGSLQVS
jgi:hypothetical protein